MQQKQRVRSLDDFRWIGAALVVAIHTSPLESVNETADFLLTRVFARVAVPFFFMVTGFFLLADEKNRKRNIVRAMRNAKKLGCKERLDARPLVMWEYRDQEECTAIPR